MKQVILASASPRRKELIGLIPVESIVMTKEVEEIIDMNKSPEENVCVLAEKKAEAVAKEQYEYTVIGCDTVVAHDGKILGKPKDEQDAYNMLESLSGQTHHVYTGVSIINKDQSIKETWAVCSKVTMKPLTKEEIKWYIGTKEPMDKAGSYGIQGQASVFVQGIEGDYFNIVGLPVNAVYEKLKMLNII